MNEITVINPNYFGDFYKKIKKCDYYLTDFDYGVIIFWKIALVIAIDCRKVYILFAQCGN